MCYNRVSSELEAAAASIDLFSLLAYIGLEREREEEVTFRPK
jgi:hypothetical protein